MRIWGGGTEGACGAPAAKAEAPGRRSWLLRMPAGYTQGRGQGRAAARSPKEGREGSEGCQPEGERRGRRQPGGCSGRGLRSAAPGGERNLCSGGAGPRPEDGGRGAARREATAGGASGAQPQ
uniref:spidroin-1-like n=1 Tax=Panthera onca TaxID=9690 RepID=UPI0009046FAE|nr:spidroin-1-like [Panthera onca]